MTLSGNNGKLGNKPFIYKRDLENAGYKDSRLWLNKYLSTAEKWDKAEIERRFELLAERFLKIWQMPEIELEEENETNEVNIFNAEDPTHKRLEYAIFFDQKIDVDQVTKLYVEVFKQLFELERNRFFSSGLAEKISLTKNRDSLIQPEPLNETYFIEKNIGSSSTKFDIIKHALYLFDSEDELTIKYEQE